MNSSYAYINTTLKSIQITQSLVNLTTQTSLNAQDHCVLFALRLIFEDLKTADLTVIQDFLQQVDSDAIVHLVRKIKKQSITMQCLQLQHDADEIYAAYVKQPPPELTLFIQTSIAECFVLNLIATQHKAKRTWLFKQPEENIIATQQVLNDLEQQTSFSNKAITQSVEDAVDFLVTAKDPNDEHFWDYFPAISIVSVSLAIYELFKRYQQQQITWQEFKWMAAKVSGLKISKIAAIGLLLGLPVIGQVTGAYLVARLLLNAKATWFDKDSVLYQDLQKKLKG
jgi:hypothetical protein